MKGMIYIAYLAIVGAFAAPLIFTYSKVVESQGEVSQCGPELGRSQDQCLDQALKKYQAYAEMTRRLAGPITQAPQ